MGSTTDDTPGDVPPPPYELHSESDVLATETRVSGTGAIEISLSSADPARLSTLLPPARGDDGISEPTHAHPAFTGTVPSLNIVVQIVGSRGDVQPFIALGRELQKSGHRVRIATHAVFADFVRESGLEFFSIGGDPSELMAYMVKNPGILPSVTSLREGDIGRKRAMIAEMLHGCHEACYRRDEVAGRPFVADAIIANPPSFAHVHCAQALGIPVHLTFTMPWSPTRQFPHPLANLSPGNVDPGVANYFSYGLVELLTWQGLGDVINKWRKTEMGLPAIAASMGPSLPTYLKIPHTYCWSPALVPKPKDWGSEIDVCGFFMRDEPKYNPPDELRQFLERGSPPIYVGFGSIVLDDPHRFVDIVLQTAKTCGIRVIISRGWSKLGEGLSNDDTVFFLGDCPHEWLFKRVAAVVHHGGAGTTSCGLLNACPTLIVPFFGDQPFWGSLIAASGAGPTPIPQKDLTIESFTAAVQFCLSPAAKEAAQSISAQMQREHGISQAVQSFHRQLPLELMTCELLPTQTARWRYEKKNKVFRLSDLAVAALVDANEAEMKDLHPLRVREYDTDVQRWDPFTGGAAAMLGTLTHFTTALGGVFVDPFAQYKRVRRTRGPDSGGAKTAAAASAGANAGAAVGALTKGSLVDVPLAITEGLRNAPRLYGGEVDEVEKVTDWKSGGKAAGKSLGVGFYRGLSGFVTNPLEGAKEEGAVGFVKGVGKGSIELVLRPSAGMIGLAAYPAQGIYKSLQSWKQHEKAKGIASAKVEMLDDARRVLADQPGNLQEEARRKWEALLSTAR